MVYYLSQLCQVQPMGPYNLGCCGILLCMDLDFAMAHRPKGFEGDPECIFFTLDTFQETSVGDIL